MDTRIEILKKAMTLFSDSGYDGVGVAKIVNELNLTKPTLYHYYGSKDGLLQGILDYYETPFLDKLETHANYDQDIILSLERVSKAYLNHVNNNSTYYRLKKYLFHSPSESNGYRILKPFRNRELSILSDLFSKITAHHTGLAKSEWALVFSFIGMMDAYSYHILSEPQSNDTLDILSRQMTKQYLYGIFSL